MVGCIAVFAWLLVHLGLTNSTVVATVTILAFVTIRLLRSFSNVMSRWFNATSNDFKRFMRRLGELLSSAFAAVLGIYLYRCWENGDLGLPVLIVSVSVFVFFHLWPTTSGEKHHQPIENNSVPDDRKHVH